MLSILSKRQQITLHIFREQKRDLSVLEAWHKISISELLNTSFQFLHFCLGVCVLQQESFELFQVALKKNK
jgi:hypothetical protein